MLNNISKIYQQAAYIQAQRLVCLLLLLEYAKRVAESEAPSETQEIVFPVAPVRNLVLAKIDSGKPSLSWQAPEGSIQGYYIYRNGQKVNEIPTVSTSYSDGYYSGGTITYGISVVDGYGSESPIREVTLPDLTIGLKEWTTLRRGALETVSIVANAPSLPLFTKEGDGKEYEGSGLHNSGGRDDFSL